MENEKINEFRQWIEDAIVDSGPVPASRVLH
jgi:hypothetical protein